MLATIKLSCYLPFQCRNLKIMARTQKLIVLPTVLYGMKLGFSRERITRRLMVFQDKLYRIFVSKKEEVIG
jgi:hypothetical protein